MSQFSVYRNMNPDTVSAVPYLLDIQNALLEDLKTRVVVPLYRRDGFSPPLQHLNPCFDVEGVALVMVTQELAGVPKKVLGAEIANLKHMREQMIGSIDFLLTGF